MLKKIIVLDVEGMSTARPYNVGYIVADNYGFIYKRRSFASLPCVWENLKNCLSAEEMTHKNVEEILSNPSKYVWTVPEKIMRALIKDCKEYNIKEIWAYNCSFDKNALKRLNEKYFKRLEKIVSFHDIWSAVASTKLANSNYVKFCYNNGFVTEKGNCQTSAEVVWKYLSKDLNFEEEHTGLADCEIEYKIYLSVKKCKKKVDSGNSMPWKIVKDFCEKNGYFYEKAE